MTYSEIVRRRMEKKEIFDMSMRIVRESGKDVRVVTKVAEVWIDLNLEKIDLEEAKKRLLMITK